jgi:putative transposase
VRNSRFSEEQIIAVLKESEAGVETGELCRRHGITRACFYRWKSKFGGMELSEAKRLRQRRSSRRARNPRHSRNGPCVLAFLFGDSGRAPSLVPFRLDPQLQNPLL